jgi:anthranilate phosphoribosyltransferase
VRELIEKLQKGKNLKRSEMQAVMTEIMSGRTTEHDMREFLIVMNEKGPTVEEITGAAQVMRKFALHVETKRPIVLDTCGTGGDAKHTFNISTTVAFVVAAAGVAVAKHGNRSVSSLCGSADVLESLGVKLDITHERLTTCLEEVGLVFLFAQRHHPAMKYVATVRKELGVKTIFNVLGPLTNPARATHQIMGVYSRHLVEQMVHVLKNLGARRVIVVHSADGMDEISTAGKTSIGELNGEEIRTYEISPEEFNFTRASLEQYKGGNKEENARILLAVLQGEKGPQRDIVLLNAAFALYAAEAVRSPVEGLGLAANLIDEGKALKVLEKLRGFTNRS